VNYLCTGFNNRCEFSKNLTNKTNINYVAFRKSKLKSKKYCVIDIQAILEE
jgi:hypothetical protein